MPHARTKSAAVSGAALPIFKLFVTFLLASTTVHAQAYPFRPLQQIYAEIHDGLAAGKRPDHVTLIGMGFVQKSPSSYQIDVGGGSRLGIVLGDATVMLSYNPAPNTEKLSDAVFAAILSRSSAINLSAPGKLSVSLPSSQLPFIQSEVLTLGFDGAVYAQTIYAVVP